MDSRLRPRHRRNHQSKRLTSISTEADNAIWSPDAHSVLFTSAVYPDCPAITPADFTTGDKCNSDRDAALASSKVKAQIFTHLLYRHWNRYTGDKRSHLFLASVDTGSAMIRKSAISRPTIPTMFRRFRSKAAAAAAPLRPTPRNWPSPKISTQSRPSAPTPTSSPSTSPTPQPSRSKISTSPGGDFNPAYSPDGKYLAWRSQARAGYESDKFRLMLYDRAAKTTQGFAAEVR